MTNVVKKGDFVELDFVGRVKITNQIFDLTVESVAKKEGLERKEKFEPLIACIGSGQLIAGFDEQIISKKLGDEFEFDVLPEKAFGKKNPKLIQLTSLAIFKKRNIRPIPGIQLDIDGALATVRSVTGGRVVLDFNHPLSGKNLHYWVKVLNIITDAKQKVEATIKLLGVPYKSVSVTDKTATITFESKLPKEVQGMLIPEIKKYVSDIDIKFA